MKTIAKHVMNVVLVSLLLLASVSKAQRITISSESGGEEVSSFEVGTYLGARMTVNLMLAVHQPGGATIRIKDADKVILYQLHLRKSSIVYQHKLNFEECKPGVYQVEISDGRQTVVRRVEVVEMPAIQAQRYITYGSQTSL